jgi:drug/metabolite transporter (DMT)-like permease
VIRSKLGQVVFWMAGAILSFCATAVSVRQLAGTFNIFEILSLRSIGGLILLLGILTVRPQVAHGLTHPMRLHVLRNSIHFAAQYMWAWSVTLLPLATVFALEFTMPGWIALLAWPLLGERMTLSRAGNIVLGFIGVLVILRPGLEAFKPAALLVLFAAFAFALSLIATKKLTMVTTTYSIVFWTMALQLPFSLVGSHPLFLLKLDLATLLPVIVISLAGVLSQLCLAKAFQAGEATLAIPLDFVRIPLIAVVGWMFYSEPLDGWVFAGAAIIVTGVVWNLRAEARKPAQMKPIAATTSKQRDD